MKRSRGTDRSGKGSAGAGWEKKRKGRRKKGREKERKRRKERREGRRREGAKRVGRDRKKVGLSLKTTHTTVEGRTLASEVEVSRGFSA